MKSLPHYLNPALYSPASVLRWQLNRASKGRVLQGPFQGLAYVSTAVGSALVPKLLGTYELELHQVIEEISRAGFDLIVDLGAAEGYYAVGLAMKAGSDLRVCAFETEPRGRALLAELAALNGVADRIAIHGTCEAVDLERILQSGAGKKFVLCDTEGYELVLLDQQTVPALADACILVELHEFVHAGLGATIKARFAASHDVTEIFSVVRKAADYPLRNWYTRLCPEKYLLDALNEHRPCQMSWLWMRPREV